MILEIMQKSFFVKKVLLASTHIDTSDYSIVRKKNVLSVLNAGKEIISTDGFSYLRVREKKYLNKGLFSIDKLIAADDSMQFDWWPSSLSNRGLDYRCDAIINGCRYEILNQASFPFWYRTKISLRADSTACDFDSMLACGCFLWMHFENQRTQTA